MALLHDLQKMTSFFVSSSTWIWPAHFAAVGFMTGLIWLIQLVHYPLMNRVSDSQFAEFHAAHSARITWIVGPVMSLELLTATALAWIPEVFPGTQGEAWLCLLLTGFVFLTTAIFAVPEHTRLARGFDRAAHSRLVARNWWRTLAWSAHLGLCFQILVTAGGKL